MIRNKITAITLISILSVSIFSPAMAKKAADIPQVTIDGLELVNQTRSSVVYAKPGATLAGYQRIKLLDAAVAFKKNWERGQRHSASITAKRISPKDIDEIKTRLAEEFQKVFTKTLETAGYQITDEIAADVMIVRPAIVNLDVNAPEVSNFGTTRTYVSSAGEMTLYLELYDAATSALILKAISRKADNSYTSHFTWANSVTNKVAADRILKGWADILVNALDESKKSTAE
ncbi:MAG: DUF3313 domain-containing protein [Xanthomonadales bacterium]|nr:DUF3313 domain-containing protein [Xanthomonadales bacterium]